MLWTNGNLDREKVKKAFAVSLKRLRTYLGLTTKDLEKLTGVKVIYLNRFLRGASEPSLSQAVIIASSFDLTVDTFVLCGLREDKLSIVTEYEIKKIKG